MITMSTSDSSKKRPKLDNQKSNEIDHFNKFHKDILIKVFNENTVDVHFVFEIDNQRLPAHKSLLSAGSKVFNAMFNGELKEMGDVKIVDTSAAAFKEFLQFFYASSVKMTMQNIVEILDCTNKYAMFECMRICEKFLQSQLNPSNACWNMHLAQMYNLNDLQKDCEMKVAERSLEVFESDSFLNCDQLTLKTILQLPEFTCNENVVFDACIKWAQQKCIEKQIDESNGKNLRNQLGDCFPLIRFKEMKLKYFVKGLTSKKGMFIASELEDILEAFQSNKFKPIVIRRIPSPFLIWAASSQSQIDAITYAKPKYLTTSFNSNRKLNLIEVIYSAAWIDHQHDYSRIPVKIRIYRYTISDKKLIFETHSNLENNETTVIFHKPVKIRPTCTYLIQSMIMLTPYRFTAKVNKFNDFASQDTIIEIHDNCSIIAGLNFRKSI